MMVLTLPPHALLGMVYGDMKQRACLGVSWYPKGPELVQLKEAGGQMMDFAILLIPTILPRIIRRGEGWGRELSGM